MTAMNTRQGFPEKVRVDEAVRREHLGVWADPVDSPPDGSHRLERFFELSTELLFIAGFDGTCRHVNPALQRMLGCAEEECLSRCLLDFVHPEDRQASRRFLDRTAAEASAVVLDNRCLTADGSTRRISWTIVPIAEEQALYGMGRDVTDREPSFLTSDEKLRTISDSALDAVVMMDQFGRVVHWNPAAERMFGYHQEEIHGRSVHETLLSNQELQGQELHGAPLGPKTPPGTVAELNVGHVIQLNALRKDGNEFPIEMAVSSFEVDGQWWATAIIRDITDRKRAERQLYERKVQLLAAQRIQRHLLPDSAPVVPGFDIAGATYPAEFAAGDHFDYLTMPGNGVGVVISDVSGHGFAPALLVASTQTLLQKLAETNNDVGEILTEANAFLAGETEDDRFVTVFLGRIDPMSRSFSYASAGHPTGYVIRANGQVKANLESTAFPLAVLPDTVIPKAPSVVLEPGDTVILLSDGVLECRSPEEQPFGSRRVIDLVRNHRDRSAREIIDRLYRGVCEFAGSESLWDDVTAIVVKVE